MKKAWLFVVLASATLTLSAQSKPLLLTAPATWRFEQFSLPPEFAPAVKYKGIEELRFAPGWGNKDAPDYFTLVFGIRFDNTRSVSQADIKGYLLTYFRELCSFTVTARKLPAIDTSAISVSIDEKPTTDKSLIYNVSLHMFGVFTDGSPVTLNMEIKVMEDHPGQKVYLLMIASPQPKTNAVWQDMYKEQREFVMPAE